MEPEFQLAANDLQDKDLASAPLVVWRFTDRKAGHDSQSKGLIEAMMELASIQVHDVPINPKGLERWNPFGKWKQILSKLPPPDWLIGAGHSTHLPMALSRWLYGGVSVVIMKPSLPIKWFNWAIIPEHDQPTPSPNIIAARGALNRIRPVKRKPAEKGLLLIGGPSKHTGWDSVSLSDQIITILKQSQGKSWKLTTSRRTPIDFLDFLKQQIQSKCGDLDPVVEIFPVEETDQNWVVDRMRESSQIWVTEESISMIYESLTSGAGVGLLNLPNRADSERSPALKGIAKLAESADLIYFEKWIHQPQPLSPPTTPFHEAERCARILLNRISSPFMDSYLASRTTHGDK